MSVELYSKGLKMKADPSTNRGLWATFREELHQANIDYCRRCFAEKRKNSIKVITNERSTGGMQ